LCLFLEFLARGDQPEEEIARRYGYKSVHEPENIFFETLAVFAEKITPRLLYLQPIPEMQEQCRMIKIKNPENPDGSKTTLLDQIIEVFGSAGALLLTDGAPFGCQTSGIATLQRLFAL